MGDFWGNAWVWISSTVESGGDVVDNVANGVGTASDTYEKVATKLDALKSDTPNKSESESLAAWWRAARKAAFPSRLLLSAAVCSSRSSI